MALRKNPKYDLKFHYKRTLEISLIITLVSLITAFKLVPRYKMPEQRVPTPPELIKVDEVPVIQPVPPPPPLPDVKIPVEAELEDIILDDVAFEETDLDENAKIAITTLVPVDDDTEEVEPPFHPFAEKMPEPVGGIGAIQSKIVYPALAIRAGLEGRVYIKAFVDQSGNVKKAEILQDIGMGCGEAALKAVMSTKFIPGEQRMKPVRVQVTIPVLFRLQ